MLQFEGEKEFSQPPQTVWAKLSDVRFLVTCIPGVETVANAEKDHAQCVLRPGFAFVRGTLELKIGLAEVEPGAAAKLSLYSKGIGSSSEVEANLRLTPTDSGTRLNWSAEVKSLGGLLKAVPQGLIKAAAQKVIADALGAIEANL